METDNFKDDEDLNEENEQLDEEDEEKSIEERIANNITEFNYPIALGEFQDELESSSKETIGYNMFREGAIAAIEEIFSALEDDNLVNEIADKIIEEYEQNHDF